ncbi:hypothetical protein Tco_1119575 [Tanacetum coccineum]
MGGSSGSETIAHSTRIILLPFSVSIPPMTENFIIPCAVDGTACIFRNPCLPMILLCGDVDLTTMKSIHVDVECSSSLIFTKSVICPNGHFISPLNPINEVPWSLESGCLVAQLRYDLVERMLLMGDMNKALEHAKEDQCPIVLKTHSHDYSTIPFKFFNSWIVDKDFPDIVSRSWSPLIDSYNTSSNPHPAISLKLRLQELKKEIRLWRQNTVLNNDALCRELKTKIEHFDVKTELGLLDDAEIE